MYTVGGPEEVAKSHIRINLLMYCQRSKWPFQPTLRRHVLLSPLGYLPWELPCSHHWHTFVRIKLDIHTSKVGWFSRYLLLLNRHPKKKSIWWGPKAASADLCILTGGGAPPVKIQMYSRRGPCISLLWGFFLLFFCSTYWLVYPASVKEGVATDGLLCIKPNVLWKICFRGYPVK